MHTSATLAAPVGRSFLRAGALALALTFALSSALSFSTQTAAHAFTGPQIPVTLPPSIATPLTTTILPAAGTAGAAVVGTVAAGLAVGGGIGTAAVCLFSNLPCALPSWGQAPEVPPNNDQPSSPPRGTGWATQAQVNYPATRAGDRAGYLAGRTDSPVEILSYPDKGVSSGSVTLSGNAVYGGSASVQCSNPTTGATSYPVNNAYVGPGSKTFTFTCVAGSVLGAVSIGASGAGSISLVTGNDPGTVGGVADPLRYAQAWRECGKLSTSSPEFLKAVGQAVAYRETQAPGVRPEMPVPACPTTHPVPYRYGVGTTTGTPLTPGTYPDTQAMPSTTRGVPLRGFPTTYPDCPFPDSCPVGRPEPGTPLKPLPAPPNPDGTPATNPDGTPKTEPVPEPAPGELPCAWGPYAVPEANCAPVPDGGVGAPQPEPSHDTTTGADPAPTPQTDPDGCLSRSVSWNPITWVLEPVKCALVWAFVPRDTEVQDAAERLSIAWEGTAPAVVVQSLGDVGAPVEDLQNAAELDCQGPPFTFPALAGVTDPFTIHPLSTCNELTTYLLGIWMPLHTAFVYLGGFFTGTRILLRPMNVDSPVQA